jgi:hypothetical protein
MGKGKGKNVIMMRVTSALKFCCFVWFYSLDWTVDLLLNSSWKRSGDSRKFVLKITNSKKQNIHLRRSNETRYFLIHFCWPEISLEINKKLEIKGRCSCCASLIAVENWGNSREVHSCAKNFGLGSSWQLRIKMKRGGIDDDFDDARRLERVWKEIGMIMKNFERFLLSLKGIGWNFFPTALINMIRKNSTLFDSRLVNGLMKFDEI